MIPAAEVRVAVAEIVLGDADTAAHGGARLAKIGGWDAALSCAENWRVAGSYHGALERVRGVPAAAAERVRASSIRALLLSRLIAQDGAAVLVELDEARVPAIAIKGLGTIAGLGARAALRTTSDVDVVVREDDAEAARAAMLARGFVEINPPFESHMRDIALSRRLHNVARALRRGHVEVDLHWRFGPSPPPALAAERLVARGRAATLGGRKIRIACPVDAVLIAVHHALRSSFDPSCVVRDVCDLRAWWDAGALHGDIDELVATASNAGLATSLLALIAIALRRDPWHGLRAVAQRLREALDLAERAEAHELAEHAEDVLLHGERAYFTIEAFAPGVYARWAFGSVARAWRERSAERAPTDAGQVPAFVAALRAAEATPPLPARIANFPRRCARVLRELTRVRCLPAYRAVARAQSRFH